METYSIAVTDLADYNAGKLRYEWFNVTDYSDVDDLEAAITDFLTNPDRGGSADKEEWFISDYDNFPNLGEYPDLDEIIAIKDAIEDGYDVEAIMEWLDDDKSRRFEVDEFRDAYIGQFDSVKAFAEWHLENCNDWNIPNDSPVWYYFDFEAYGRELTGPGDYWYSNGYVFLRV